jgi:hypothetical protein
MSGDHPASYEFSPITQRREHRQLEGIFRAIRARGRPTHGEFATGQRQPNDVVASQKPITNDTKHTSKPDWGAIASVSNDRDGGSE